MSEPESLQTTKASVPTKIETPFNGKDWLASISFGDGFKRSIYLLSLEYASDHSE